MSKTAFENFVVRWEHQGFMTGKVTFPLYLHLISWLQLPTTVKWAACFDHVTACPLYAYNRHLSFDVAFICSTLTHCGVCHLSVWRLKWEVSYVHQSVWRWKWFFCQSNYVLQRQNVRYCFPTGNRFTAAVGLWNMLWWYSFPTAKECTNSLEFTKTSCFCVFGYTVEPVLKTTCVKRPTFSGSQKWNSHCNSPVLRDHNFSVPWAVS